MKATEPIIDEFTGLNERYSKAQERMSVLQRMAIEGMRKVGVGCITQESRAEFAALQKEIADTLARMREICDTLH